MSEPVPSLVACALAGDGYQGGTTMQDEADTNVLETLLRTGDPIHASVVLQALEGEGILAIASGLDRRTLVGVIGTYVDIAIRVSASDLDRAREVLAALESQTTVLDDESDVEASDEPERADVVPSVEAILARHRPTAHIETTIDDDRATLFYAYGALAVSGCAVLLGCIN